MFAVSNIGGLQTALDAKAENIAINTVSPLQEEAIYRQTEH
jgi:hypothetical protein